MSKLARVSMYYQGFRDKIFITCTRVVYRETSFFSVPYLLTVELEAGVPNQAQ